MQCSHGSSEKWISFALLYVGYMVYTAMSPVYEKSVILFYCYVDSGADCDFNQSGKQPHESTGMTECGKFWLSSFVVVWWINISMDATVTLLCGSQLTACVSVGCYIVVANILWQFYNYVADSLNAFYELAQGNKAWNAAL